MPFKTLSAFVNVNHTLHGFHAKKELGQYPAILTSRSVNNTYMPFAHVLILTKSLSKHVTKMQVELSYCDQIMFNDQCTTCKNISSIITVVLYS